MRLLFENLKKYNLKLFILIISVVLQITSQGVIIGHVSNAVEFAMTSIKNGIENRVLYSTLFKDSMILLLLDIVSALMAIVTGYFSSDISSSVGYDIREKIYEKVMSFSLHEFDRFTISTLINRSTNDVKVVQDVLYLFLFGALQAPIYAIVGIVFVFNIKSGLDYIVFILVLVVIITIIIMFKLVFPLSNKLQKKTDALNLVTRESLKGVKDIRSYNMEDWSYEKNVKVCESLKDINTKYNGIIILFLPIMNLFWSMSSVIIIYTGVYKVLDNIISVGDLLAFANYVQLIVMGFLLLASIFMQLPKAISSLIRIEEVVYVENIITDGTLKLASNEKIDSIIFKHVDFKYDFYGGNVIEDINFELKKGKTYAIIGETGSGKSTIIKLIERLYDVTTGEIFINNKNIKEYNIKDLRSHIAYVPQKKYLFMKSVKENITFATNDDISNEEIENASKISCSDEFINKKENKFDEILTQNGSNFSGGQRQRLTIARALINNRDVYLFDDSYSALDVLTAKKIKNTLKERIKDSIILVITQRASQIEDADEIFVFDKGKIVGIGNHNKLLDTCDVYKEILKSQEKL